MNRPKWLRKAVVLLLAVFCAAVLLLSRLGLCHMGARGARESVLRQDLQTMRMAIDNCTLDKKQAPQSVQDLVNEHYLRVIPTDPFTKKKDWVPYFSDTLLPTGQTTTGISDVHSNSSQVGSTGRPYNTW